MKKLSVPAREHIIMAIYRILGLEPEDTDRLVTDWCAVMGEDYSSALFRLLFNAMTDGMHKKDLYTWIEAGDA